MPRVTNRVQLLLFLIFLFISLACGFESDLFRNFVSSINTLPQPTPTPTRYNLGLTSVSAGLDQLESYRVNLILEFKGDRNGQAVAGKIESLTEITQQPAAFHRFVKADVITPTAKIVDGTAEYFHIDNKIYAKKAGETTWLSLNASQASPADLGLVELDRFIVLPPSVAGPPQPETLAGLSVEHYSFDEHDLASPNIFYERAQGDLWVASHGNFLAQYVISASVKISIPDPQADIFEQGQLTLRYSLTDINNKFTIMPPAGVITGVDTFNHIPRPSDAEIITALPTLIEYTSAISSVSATLFYRDELTALEWTENSSEIFNEKSFLTFSKESETLTILITPAADPGKIRVVLDIKNGP